jgi:hypothetical protein
MLGVQHQAARLEWELAPELAALPGVPLSRGRTKH